MLEIIYYIDSKKNNSPIRDDILSIKKDLVKIKIKAAILHLAQNHGISPGLLTKNIRGFHFSEIRIKFSKSLYRILYFIWRDEKMILLHIFLKKEGEVTPQKELKKAERRYEDFLNNIDIYD